MNDAELQKMSEVEDKLWWYNNLHAQVLKALSGVSKEAKILDAGCGTGGLLNKLSLAGFSNLAGFDLAAESVNLTRKHGFDTKQLSISDINQHYQDSAFDCVISCDVLCYYKEAEKTELLKNIGKVLKPNGKLILNLPVYSAFAGIHDLSVGIVSRSTKSTLSQQLHSTGFRIKSLHHWPFLLAPLIYLTRLKQRQSLKKQKILSQYRSDVDLPSPILNTTFKLICSGETFLGKLRCWGSSIFVIAEKCS